MRKLLSVCCALLVTLALAPPAAHAATDASGIWTGSMQTGGGDFQLTFTFKVDGDKLTGTVQGEQGEPFAISNGKVDGDKITFNIDFQGATISYDCTVSGDEIKLSSKSSDGSFPPNTMTLKRSKPTAAP
jgi:hypothetical protein